MILSIGCGAETILPGASHSTAGSGSIKPIESVTKHHDLPDELYDNDAGVVTVDDSSSIDDARIAVAFCAAAVLDSQEKVSTCNSHLENATLITNCDTGLMIHWNCDACGDVSKNGQDMGHILMLSNAHYRVTNEIKKIYYECLLDSNGAGFTASPF